MEKKREWHTIRAKGIILFILLLMLMVINEVTEIGFDTAWLKNIDVWINDFFVNTFVFFAASILLSKITNELLNFGVSYILSILIGNFIHLDSSNFNVTPQFILFVVFDIFLLIWFGCYGYNKGKRKRQRAIAEEEYEYIQTVLRMDNITRSELYNLKKFIKKHPKECEAIDKFGIDFVMKFVQDDKEIRKAVKINKDTNDIKKTQ